MTSILIESPPVTQLNSPVIKRLSSGLTIVAEQMPIEAVNLSLWLRVGSVVESDAINGMAHYLEHMVFKGTPNIKCGEFERLIEERGAVTNAATSQDYTQYYITTAPQDFKDLAPLQIELVMNPTIPDEAFERERPIILEEIRRSEDNPRRRTFHRSMEMAFERLPYRRPVLGPASVIEQLTAQQMRDFHTRWYRPASITAVAVGNLPVDSLVEIVADGFRRAEENRCQAWGLSPNCDGEGALHSTLPIPEPPFQSISRIDYVDKTLQQARLVMSWRVPGMIDLSQTYALDILASILGRGRTARLIRDLREERRLVNSLSISNMTYGHQGVFYITAQLPVEQLAEVEAAIADHVNRLCTEPVTELELRRIRNQVANRYIFGNETPSDRAGLYGYYQAITGDLAHAINYPSHIQSLQAADLQAAAQRYLSPTAYGVMTVRPEG
ncbi:MAG: pitrilysin family protein [Leptolyngbyaceae cyanobacterium MO_188.B28]|nr:pitrilysin family protein [Leptolyngbyaceae cyanobacterium MO_188.B28]